MKKEFYRLIHSKMFYISLFIYFIVFLFLLTYISISSEKKYTNIYIDNVVYKYNSKDDIVKYIDEIKLDIINLDSKSESYNDDLNNYNKTLKIYEYLNENYIPYDKLLYSTSIYLGSYINPYNYISIVSSYLIFELIFIIILTNTILFSSQFDNGSYKYMYSINRRRTLKNKIIVSFIVLIGIIFLSFILTIIFDLLTFQGEKQKLLFYGYDKVFVINYFLYLILSLLSILLFSISYFLLINGIFILCKKSVSSIIISISYLLVLVSLTTLLPTNVGMILFQLPIFTIGSYLPYNLLYSYLISLSLFIISLFYFNRRSL